MNVVMCLWMVAVAGWVKFFRPRLPMTLRMAYNLDLNLTQCFIESSPVRSSWGCWGKQKSSQLPIFLRAGASVLAALVVTYGVAGCGRLLPWINQAIVHWKCGGDTFKPSEPLGRVNSIVLPKAGWTVARWEITGRRSSFAFLVGWITWIEQIAEFPWTQIGFHRCIHLWLV